MPDESETDPACAVCERRLLPGEKPIRFVTREGAEVDVCELCKPRAEAAGWLRPDEFEAMRGAAPARERRRPRGAQALGGFLSRLGGPGEEPDPDAAVGNAPEYAGVEEPLADLPPISLDPAAPGTSIPDALYAFNHSNHRRTVAGLTRTLGPPRATAIAIKNGDGLPGIRLTIAWELTWYQWEIGPNGRTHDVRESGKGETIDQLRTDDRSWNLMVDADGTLQQKVAPAPVDGA